MKYVKFFVATIELVFNVLGKVIVAVLKEEPTPHRYKSNADSLSKSMDNHCREMDQHTHGYDYGYYKIK